MVLPRLHSAKRSEEQAKMKISASSNLHVELVG